MNTNSITQRLELFTAVFTGSIYIDNIQPTARCVNSFGKAGTSFNTNSTYGLEIGAISPTQSKDSRARYDKGAFFYKFVRLEDGDTPKFATIEALSSLDENANKGGSQGMYWLTTAIKEGEGYAVEAKYVWDNTKGPVGGIPHGTCKATYYISGDNFDDTWLMKGNMNATGAKISWTRNMVEAGVLVQTLIFTFDGKWDDQTAKLLTNSSTVQTEGQWVGFKTSDAVKSGGFGMWGVVCVGLLMLLNM